MPATRLRFAWIVSVERSGRIRTRRSADAGDIVLFRLTDFRVACRLIAKVRASARHARIGTGLFVPGVPEASNDDEALEALKRWNDRIVRDLRREIPERGWKPLRGAA